MLILLTVCVALLVVFDILLVCALLAFWRALNADARKRGLLDAVDLLYKKRKWYA